MPFLPLVGVSNACALIVPHLLATTPEHRTILVKRTLFSSRTTSCVTWVEDFPRRQSEAHDVHNFVEDKHCFPAQSTDVQIAVVR